MTVNITSERIPTPPGIKVKFGNKSKATPSHGKAFELTNFVFSMEVVPENS